MLRWAWWMECVDERRGAAAGQSAGATPPVHACQAGGDWRQPRQLGAPPEPPQLGAHLAIAFSFFSSQGKGSSSRTHLSTCCRLDEQKWGVGREEAGAGRHTCCANRRTRAPRAVAQGPGSEGGATLAVARLLTPWSAHSSTPRHCVPLEHSRTL